MNRNIEVDAVEAIHVVEDRNFNYQSSISEEIVHELVARKLLVGEIDGKDTLALEQIKERHKTRLEAEKQDGVLGGIRDDFEVVLLLGIIDKLMRNG